MKKKKQQKANVFINLEGVKNEIGTLIYDDRKIYFKIKDTFLDNNLPFKGKKLSLSPFKIEHSNQIQVAPHMPYEGLFGLFSDSLPDAWGKLLIDRYLKSKNLELLELNPLLRLLYVGKNGNGALEYEPHEEYFKSELSEIDLNEFNLASQKIIIGENSMLLDDFYRLGGTSGGARPKMSVGFNPKTNHLIPINSYLPKNYENWLVKFPSTFDLPEIANIEYAYYKMAIACGIEMSDSKLLVGEKDSCFFVTKRFDRNENGKLHLHSFAGLIHDDFTQCNLDYGHLLDAAFYLVNSKSVQQKIFKLAAFNVFSSNQDDHSKNFSFIFNKKKEWKFAPAYDLTFSPSKYDFNSMSVAKKHKNIQTNDLLDLAKHFQILNADKIVQEVKETINNWQYFAKDAGVKKSTIFYIKKVLEKKMK
ncbi:MAG: HipA domain-containing protein [Flavobacteriia bacterium]|nr:HipA domain-containing protein [Flavobacteriia bacterium]